MVKWFQALDWQQAGLLYFGAMFVLCALVIAWEERRQRVRARQRRRAGFGARLPRGPHHSCSRPGVEAVPE